LPLPLWNKYFKILFEIFYNLKVLSDEMEFFPSFLREILLRDTLRNVTVFGYHRKWYLRITKWFYAINLRNWIYWICEIAFAAEEMKLCEIFKTLKVVTSEMECFTLREVLLEILSCEMILDILVTYIGNDISRTLCNLWNLNNRTWEIAFTI